MKIKDWLLANNKNILLEAAYGSGNMEKAANLLAIYLAKKYFGILYPWGGKKNYSEKYKKSNGNTGIGYRFITDSGKACRIDFDSTGNGTLTGVTIWDNIKNEAPSTYINIPTLFNTIEATQYIISTILQTGSVTTLQSLQESTVNEAKANLTSNYHPSLLGPDGKLKRFAWDAQKKFGIDITNKTADQIKTAIKSIKVEKAGIEQTSRDDDVTKAQTTLDSKKYADVDTIFEDLKDLVNMVVKGSQPSLLITGSPGTGKTYSVSEVIKKELGSEGSEWVVAKGKVTPMGLYSVLFANRKKLIVFDDSDSVFGDKDAINILKAALDSYDTRMVSWYSKSTQDVTNFSAKELDDFYANVEQQIKDGDPKIKLPNRFEFFGKIIFISNLESRQVDTAVKSRSFVIDITLSRSDLLKRIESVLPKIGGDTDIKIKREVFDTLKDYEGAEDINMRSFLKALRVRESGSSRWKELIRNYV